MKPPVAGPRRHLRGAITLSELPEKLYKIIGPSGRAVSDRSYEAPTLVTYTRPEYAEEAGHVKDGCRVVAFDPRTDVFPRLWIDEQFHQIEESNGQEAA